MWGAAHPDRWGSLISISGEEYAGTEKPDTVLKDVFQGDQAAYDASKPQASLTKNGGHFSGHLAIFTAGENDPAYVAASQRTALGTRRDFAVNRSPRPPDTAEAPY